MAEKQTDRCVSEQLYKEEYGEQGSQNRMSHAFRQALSDFTFDAACGGAIRHLAGLGFTAKEVHERLSFPVSYERVRQAYTKYLLDTGVLLREDPASGCGVRQKTYTYVQEEGKYGRRSFRRVEVEKETEPEAGAERVYAACNFGRIKEPGGFAVLGLDAKQQEYLEGICWEKRTMYHLMNDRMRGITEALAGQDCIGGGSWTEKREDQIGSKN